MKTIPHSFPSALIAVVAAVCAPAALGQSLAMTYDLTGDALRAASSNAACAAYGWSQSTGACAQQPLARYSREGEQRASKPSPSLNTVAAPGRQTGPQPAEPSLIPYLGESASRSTDARSANPDREGQPDFNFHLGSRARAGRSEEELERRLRNAAYEARANRSSFNAVGLELVVPIQARVVKSADPAPPE